tara:strand:+ start:465 stop:1166 length:702 start_codon:yes stop_codon:yes gene_type:complete
MKEKIKKILIYAFITLVILLFISILFQSNSDKELFWRLLIENYNDLQHIASKNQIISFNLFLLLYFFIVALSLPIASFLTLVSAILFGWLTVFCVIPATIGSWTIFFITKKTINKKIPVKILPYLKSVKKNFQQAPFRWLLFMRLLPVMPFWAVNIIPAFLGMRSKDYIYATIIGIFPGTLIYTSLGKGFKKVIESNQVPNLSSLAQVEIILPLILLSIFVVCNIFYTKPKDS